MAENGQNVCYLFGWNKKKINTCLGLNNVLRFNGVNTAKREGRTGSPCWDDPTCGLFLIQSPGNRSCLSALNLLMTNLHAGERESTAWEAPPGF